MQIELTPERLRELQFGFAGFGSIAIYIAINLKMAAGQQNPRAHFLVGMTAAIGTLALIMGIGLYIKLNIL